MAHLRRRGAKLVFLENLMPAQYVKAYIKRNKQTPPMRKRFARRFSRPTMQFVPVNTAEQQATPLLHRGREQLVRQHTMLVNALRAHLAEFGMVAAQGLRNGQADRHCLR
jgi:transposase